MKRLHFVQAFIAPIVSGLLSLTSLATHAGIDGVSGNSFSFSASEGYVSIADGGSIYSWGYSVDGSPMQLPGPTLLVAEGDTVTITLSNNLPIAAGNVSIVFPGQDVSATGGVEGPLTREAPNGGSVTYTFTADHPGTFQYHSGSQPDLQVEMGLYGALIVTPSAPPPTACAHIAYSHPGSCFDREYLFLLSEIDLDVHLLAEQQARGSIPIRVPAGDYRPEYWLMNGRAAPDTMESAGSSLFPHQPYGSLAQMHPGEKVLMRIVGAGRQMHPFHHHGNHARVIARDGNPLLSATDASKLAGPTLFTVLSIPGETVDSVFEWTGKDLGWDIYGHAEGDGSACDGLDNGYHSVATDPNYHEWCADHTRPIPVTLPSLNSMAFGGFYSGSPYLGALGSLPPGEGGLNPNAGFAYMWHSHTERELVNNDIFPGGMMTMLIIEAPSVPID